MKALLSSNGYMILVDDAFVSDKTWKVHAFNGKRYAHRWGNGQRTIYLHREITGAQSGEDVDHINNDGLDNRGVNLLRCSHRRNMSHIVSAAKMVKTNTSGFRVVYLDGNGYIVAQVYENTLKKQVWLGTFPDKVTAAKAYDTAVTKIRGERAMTNHKLGLLED